jgi:hypothetical protein
MLRHDIKVYCMWRMKRKFNNSQGSFYL